MIRSRKGRFFCFNQAPGWLNAMKRKGLNFWAFTLLFFVFWIAVSGSLHWQQLLIGAAASLFVAYFNRSLLIAPAERPPVHIKNLLRLAAYVLRLLFDIVRANCQVAWIVIQPRMPSAPRLVTLEVDLPSAGSRVLLANSITLTPGTLTVLAEGNQYLVHALTPGAGEGLEDWDLIKKLKRMEEERR
jgi:multicomponent Na+:H+ antiporter subunit E